MKIKKRYIAATAIAAITGIGFWGHSLNQQAIADCNAGNDKECQTIARIYGTDYSEAARITNPAYQQAVAVLQEKEAKDAAEIAAHKSAREKEANKFKVTDRSVINLAVSCEQKQIRPFLHDPNSFRSMGHTYKETVDKVYVQVNYTATNGFGGRVQGSKVCSYTL